MSKRISRLGTGLLAVAAALLLVAGPSAAAPSKHQAAATTIRVWTDKDRKAAVEKVVGAWASSKGLSVEVVEKDFGKIRDDLKTVQPETAPDVIIGAHDWTGQLAADGLVLPLFPSAATQGAVPGVRARRVLLRHRRQAPLRRPGRAREHRPRREHEARQGPDDLRASCPLPCFPHNRQQKSPRPRNSLGSISATTTRSPTTHNSKRIGRS